jgi:hypothetical protein
VDYEEAEDMLRLEYQDGDDGSWLILNERGEVLGSYLDQASALAQYVRMTGGTAWRPLATVQSRDGWKDGFRAGYSQALRDSGDHWLQERVSSFTPLQSAGSPAVLLTMDPYRFRYWALGLIDGRPVREDREQPPGIDGRLTFYDEGFDGKAKQVLIVVEPVAQAADIERLTGTVEREHAEIGVLITQREPDDATRAVARAAGHYQSPWSGASYERLQILPVAGLAQGKTIAYPRVRDKRTVATTTAHPGSAPSAGVAKPGEHREFAWHGDAPWQDRLPYQAPQPPAR